MFLCFFYSDNDSNSGNSSGKKDGNEIRKATRRSYPYPIDITNNSGSDSSSSSNSGCSNSGVAVGAVAQPAPTTTIITTTAAAPTTTTTSNNNSNNLVAVKVVPKQEFWQRVLTGKFTHIPTSLISSLYLHSLIYHFPSSSPFFVFS